MAISRDGAGLVVLMAVCTAVAAVVTLQPHHVADSHLVRLAAVVSVMAFVIVPILHFHQMHKKEIENLERQAGEREKEAKRRDEERVRVINSLREELLGVLVVFRGKKYVDGITMVRFRGEFAVFCNRHLYHDIYDTIIHAGMLLFINYDLLQLIQDVYRSIKRHNRYLDQLHESLGGRSLDEITEAEFRICKMIEEEDRVLAEKAPTAAQKLREF